MKSLTHKMTSKVKNLSLRVSSVAKDGKKVHEDAQHTDAARRTSISSDAEPSSTATTMDAYDLAHFEQEWHMPAQKEVCVRGGGEASMRDVPCVESPQPCLVPPAPCVERDDSMDAMILPTRMTLFVQDELLRQFKADLATVVNLSGAFGE